MKEQTTKKLEPQELIERIEKLFEIDDLSSKCRDYKYVLARKMFIYYVRKYHYMGWTSIGRCISRTHGNMIHHFNDFHHLLNHDKDIRNMWSRVTDIDFNGTLLDEKKTELELIKEKACYLEKKLYIYREIDEMFDGCDEYFVKEVMDKINIIIKSKKIMNN